MGQACITGTSWIHEEWSLDERNDVDGMKTAKGCVAQLHAHFHMKTHKRVHLNLDTGVAVDTFPVNFDREGVGDGRFHDWDPRSRSWAISRIR